MEKKKAYHLGKYTTSGVTHVLLLLFVFISIMPLLWIWLAALQPKELQTVVDPFAFPKGITFANIVHAWTKGKMGLYMRNSLLVALPRVAIVLLFSSLAGFAFGKLKWKGQNLVFGFILIGMMVPIQAMIIPVYYNVQRIGLINTHLALILPYFGMSMPFGCFMMRSFYRDLPTALMDAARIDGCNKLSMWARIMMPLTKPALVSLLIFEFMWSWNDYLLPTLMVYSDKVRTMPVGLNAFRGEYASDQTLIAAAVTICTVPIIVVYILFQRSFVDGITAGAVKG